MPEAVSVFGSTGSFKETLRVKSGIVETFRLDLHKYAAKADTRLLTIAIDSLPRQLGRKLIYLEPELYYWARERKASSLRSTT